jgi:hypothetical protein
MRQRQLVDRLRQLEDLLREPEHLLVLLLLGLHDPPFRLGQPTARLVLPVLGVPASVPRVALE